MDSIGFFIIYYIQLIGNKVIEKVHLYPNNQIFKQLHSIYLCIRFQDKSRMFLTGMPDIIKDDEM